MIFKGPCTVCNATDEVLHMPDAYDMTYRYCMYVLLYAVFT